MTSKPRNRVVVFRVSQEEYRLLKEACDRAGARNLSDFTRSEVLENLASEARSGRLRCRFAFEEFAQNGTRPRRQDLASFYPVWRRGHAPLCAWMEQRVRAMQSQLDSLLQGVPHEPRPQP